MAYISTMKCTLIQNCGFALVFLLQMPLCWSQTQLETPQDSTSNETPDTMKVEIINANTLSANLANLANGSNIYELAGDVETKQNNALFYSQKAIIYEEANKIEAEEKVKMVMPDGVSLSGERLEYDGNTRIVEVYDTVMLRQYGTQLETNHLTFYREEEYGYYQTGGKLRDGNNVLTSQRGYYYSKESMAFFKGNVHVKNPNYEIETDSLVYDSDTEIIYFVTTTEIVGEKGNILTEGGFYDSQSQLMILNTPSTVYDSVHTIYADSIFYLHPADLGKAFKHVHMVKQDSGLNIYADVGFFRMNAEDYQVAGNVLLSQPFDKDTLYISSDTLVSGTFAVPVSNFSSHQFADSVSLSDDLFLDVSSDYNLEMEPPKSLAEMEWDSLSKYLTFSYDSLLPSPSLAEDDISQTITPPDSVDSLTLSISPSIASASDSLSIDSSLLGKVSLIEHSELNVEKKDTTIYENKKLAIANKRVRIFYDKLQAIADSMVYFQEDSIIHLYKDPVIWYDTHQLSGDTIFIWLKNKQVDSLWISGKAFVMSKADTLGFNQIKGVEIQAKLVDNQLSFVRVTGNNESIFFVKESENSQKYRGMNQITCHAMTMYFEENEVSTITFLKQPEGVFYPLYEVIGKENMLSGADWRSSERPNRPFARPLLAKIPFN